MKCGLRFRYLELVNDGYFKELQVCQGCYDGPHPQEKLLRVSDPVALWRGTPDTVYPPTAPVLDAPVVVVSDVQLAWTASQSPDSGVAGYRVLRVVSEDETSLIADLPVTRDAFAGIISEPLSYTVEALAAGEYSFRVAAYDMRNPALVSSGSNIVSVTVP